MNNSFEIEWILSFSNYYTEIIRNFSFRTTFHKYLDSENLMTEKIFI